MICADATLDSYLDIVRGEFAEMPGLILTRSQFRRLWALDDRTCGEVIEALMKSGFLRRTIDGHYARPQ
jgi:hypothetical protein